MIILMLIIIIILLNNANSIKNIYKYIIRNITILMKILKNSIDFYTIKIMFS